MIEFFNYSFWQGVIASLLVALLLSLLTPVRKKLLELKRRRKLIRLEQKLEEIKWEKEHIEKVNISSLALNRSVYHDISFVLLCMSFGIGLPVIGPVLVDLNGVFAPIVKILLPLAIPTWFVSLIIAFQLIKKFKNLQSYSKTIERFEKGIDVLEIKIDSLTSE